MKLSLLRITYPLIKGLSHCDISEITEHSFFINEKSNESFLISCHVDGNVKDFSYFVGNSLSRLPQNGPAYMYFDSEGRIFSLAYYLESVHLIGFKITGKADSLIEKI